MECETTPGSNRTRIEALEGNQKEIMAALADMKATTNQLSLDIAEKWEHVKRRVVEHDGARRRNGRSSAARHQRPRAEGMEEFHGGSDSGKSRQDEEHQWKGRRRGGRIEGRGVIVERWLEETDDSRASHPGRGQNDWSHHGVGSKASDGGLPLHRRRPLGQVILGHRGDMDGVG